MRWFGFMRRFIAILFLGSGTLAASGQAVPRAVFPLDARVKPGVKVHTSLTRQFVIREPDYRSRNPIPLGNDRVKHYVRVDPTLLPISCERIKHAFLTELDAPDRWQEQIFIELQHARTLNDPIIIASSQSIGRGWSYHVSMPDTVEDARLVVSVVDVLLLEMANRQAAQRSAEIPAWLGYGVSEDVMRSAHLELVLEPAKPDANGLKIGTMDISGTNTNSLALAHIELSMAQPLTIDQLSWPDESQLDGPSGGAFRSSAQLFVHDLLRLRGGPAAMRAFIQALPQHLNWQLTFLDAFRGDFAGQLELEKWWALQLVDFTGRDISQTWNPEESWQKLVEIVRPTVEVRTRLNELPLRTQVSLQTIIEKWDMAAQYDFLQEKSKLLFALRSRASQDVAKLVDDYRRAIDLYLDKRIRSGYIHTARAQAVLGLDRVARQTIGELNVLDSIREDLRPKQPAVQAVDARQHSNN